MPIHTDDLALLLIIEAPHILNKLVKVDIGFLKVYIQAVSDDVGSTWICNYWRLFAVITHDRCYDNLIGEVTFIIHNTLNWAIVVDDISICGLLFRKFDHICFRYTTTSLTTIKQIDAQPCKEYCQQYPQQPP